MVDNPYLFGQIAAANSLSDVYAMGGQPLTAMNITTFPACTMDLGILRDILAGGADKVIEAKALLVGGHTVDDKEPKYGLSVTGTVHPEKVATNSGARVDDYIILTKPIGTGIVTTALKAEFVTEKEIAEVITSMATLNKAAYEAMLEAEVRAATDITGFGILGHLYEMCAASNVSAELNYNNIPVWSQALEYLKFGLIPAGSYNNRKYLENKIHLAQDISEADKDILFDPQTSGGLLLAVRAEKLAIIKERLTQSKVNYQIIGRMIPSNDNNIFVRKG